jgi:hypothetical protein
LETVIAFLFFADKRGLRRGPALPNPCGEASLDGEAVLSASVQRNRISAAPTKGLGCFSLRKRYT